MSNDTRTIHARIQQSYLITDECELKDLIADVRQERDTHEKLLQKHQAKFKVNETSRWLQLNIDIFNQAIERLQFEQERMFGRDEIYVQQ